MVACVDYFIYTVPSTKFLYCGRATGRSSRGRGFEFFIKKIGNLLEAPAPKAASTGGKKKITANEKEILSRTLPQTKTAPEPETNRKESPKKKKAPGILTDTTTHYTDTTTNKLTQKKQL